MAASTEYNEIAIGMIVNCEFEDFSYEICCRNCEVIAVSKNDSCSFLVRELSTGREFNHRSTFLVEVKN